MQRHEKRTTRNVEQRYKVDEKEWTEEEKSLRGLGRRRDKTWHSITLSRILIERETRKLRLT